VDNAPTTAATAELVAGLRRGDRRVRYVREDRAGLGWAHRRGLLESTSEIVAFTDDDVRVDRHWIAGLMEGFAGDASVGCVTGLILPAELQTPAQVWYEQYGGFAKGFRRRVFDLGAHRPPEPLFPFTAGRLGAGANMAFRRSTLVRAGGFDPALGPGTPTRGGEDIDVFFKTIAGGSQLVYEPAALVYHTHRRSYAELRSQLATWGIGFSAFLTAAVLARPDLALRLLPRLPTAVRHALRVRSREYRVEADAYPDELTRPTFPPDLRRAELATLPSGPLAYLRERASVRARLAADRSRGLAEHGPVAS
jgi:O-antigen biosynthesis protein